VTAAVPKGKGGVNRDALPRYPDGTQWWPPGLAREATDEQLAAALRGAWGTPRWTLDLALDVREMLGGPAAALGFDLDAGTRPDTASWALSRMHLDGSIRGDAMRGAWASIARGARSRMARSEREARQCAVTIWCNFPFADPKPWVQRALQAAADGCWVSVLAPHTTGAWWDDLRCSMLAEVPLRKVCFEACPGLLDAHGRPASGDAPSQQCSLVILAPPNTPPPTSAIVLAREVPRPGLQRFVVQPGPGSCAHAR
jgi:hypothetical protein